MFSHLFNIVYEKLNKLRAVEMAVEMTANKLKDWKSQ